MVNSIHQVFQRFTDCNITLNWNKFEFFQTTIKYLGHIVNSNGIRPNPDKMSAIINLQIPQNITELTSFLGSVNFQCKFIRAPHDELLLINKNLYWSPECENEFVKFKDILSSDVQIAHYNQKLPIIVSADASVMPDGNEKPVAHASRI